MAIVEHPQSLLLTVGIFLFMAYGMYRTFIQGKTPHIRKLAPIEAIDEGIGRAVEMGRGVHCGLPEARLVGEVVAETLNGVALLGFVARKVAKAGIPGRYTTSEPQTLSVIDAVVHDAYALEGKLDIYGNPAMCQVNYYAGAYVVPFAAMLQRDNIGFSMITGSMGKSMLMVGSAHFDADTFSIMAHPAYDKLEWAIPTFDYVLMLQETFTAGAWITGDKAQLGSVVGTDIATWTMFALSLIFFVVANILGTRLTGILTG